MSLCEIVQNTAISSNDIFYLLLDSRQLLIRRHCTRLELGGEGKCSWNIESWY